MAILVLASGRGGKTVEPSKRAELQSKDAGQLFKSSQLEREFDPVAAGANAIGMLIANIFLRSFAVPYATTVVLSVGLLILLAFRIRKLISYAIEGASSLPSCEGCGLKMRRTARFSRLCRSREEVVFGYRDCLAALKNGLWEDAVKLLLIHGSASQSDSNHFLTPARYNLDFFECGLCSQHAARLNIDEKVDGRWDPQEALAQAYWRGTGVTCSRTARLMLLPRSWMVTAGGALKRLAECTVSANAVIMVGAIAAVGIVIVWLNTKP